MGIGCICVHFYEQNANIKLQKRLNDLKLLENWLRILGGVKFWLDFSLKYVFVEKKSLKSHVFELSSIFVEYIVDLSK